MAGIKEFFFTPQDLVNLLTHYSDGEVPLGAEVTDILRHPALERKIGLLIKSEEWDSPSILFLGYDGKRISSWAKGEGQDKIQWEERNETPRRQN